MRTHTRLTHACLALTILALTATTIQAQSDPPLITDPTGDAGLQGVAAPVLWDLFDIETVHVTETADTATIHIETAAPGTEPPAGEIAVHFQANGSWWLMGWSTVTFPAPPFVYQGGFFCPSDPDHGFDAATCGALPATFAPDTLQLTVDREAFGITNQGTTIQTPTAYAVLYDANGNPLPIDETDIGGTYTFQTGDMTQGDQTPTTTDTPTSPDQTHAGKQDTQSDGTSTTDAQNDANTRVSGEAPALPVPVTILMVALAAVAAARRTP